MRFYPSSPAYGVHGASHRVYGERERDEEIYVVVIVWNIFLRNTIEGSNVCDPHLDLETADRESNEIFWSQILRMERGKNS